jgi:hypothetical protein
MTESPISVSAGKTSHALDELRAYVDERRRARSPVADFESFEREARRRFAAAEAEFVAEELARLDVDAPVVEIDGVAHRRVLRCPQTYMTAAGPVTVERTLYSTRQDDARAVCAMELRAGIVEGYFTPLAAANAAWAVAHLTPGESEALFARMGGMNPSKSARGPAPQRRARSRVRRGELARSGRIPEAPPHASPRRRRRREGHQAPRLSAGQAPAQTQAQRRAEVLPATPSPNAMNCRARPVIAAQKPGVALCDLTSVVAIRTGGFRWTRTAADAGPS